MRGAYDYSLLALLLLFIIGLFEMINSRIKGITTI
jgi:hypothetical protein